MPQYLNAYRTATWRLFLLGSQHKADHSPQPALVLASLTHLNDYWLASSRKYDVLTLASTKKSFVQTHYRKMKLPKRPHEVILPFGPSLAYYDKDSKIWAHDLASKPDYRYLLGNIFPKGIIDPYLGATPSIKEDFHHPSSFEIVANSLVCPHEMSVHEFNALQRLLSSRGRRWLVILVELSSNNINFSSESAMLIMNHMALQAGPAVHEDCFLREAHVILSDRAFCKKLHEQILKRLDALTATWREVYCMCILITLSLRAYYVAPDSCRSLFLDLLVKARNIVSE